MSDNSKRIKKVIKLLSQFSKQQNKLEKALEKLEWPMDLFFISLTNEILIELEKNDIQNQTPAPKVQKRGSILSINLKLNLDKPEKKYLYQLINIFDEIKKYKETLKEEIIEYIMTPENIQKILLVLMSKNKNTNAGYNNSSNEMNEFNTYIMEFLINIINLNNKILIGALSSESQYNVFCQLFIFFSKTEENRNLLYELERNIFLYYPKNNNLKEIINYTINCIDEELEMNKNSCKKIIGEIKQILFLYKNDIRIINKEMSKLIINIFKLFENEIGKHYFINDFLKFCFNEICFDGNNKYYSRYNFTSANKSKTMNPRSSNLSLGINSDNSSQISNSTNIKNDDEISNEGNAINTENNNSNCNNNINENKNIIKNSKTQININDNKINNEDESKINNNEDKNNKYNVDFINFLFDIYQELIKQKLKNSYSIFFIELFLSINNSNEGKKEYLFLINNTNYIKIILPSLLQLKDESLIAVYFSKIIFLSISDNNNINGCYSPEVDLNFFINNINSFFDDNEDKNIYNVISSQIMNLIKMNNDVIDIILNKCNIYEVIISIINNDKYSIEIKRKIIEFLETIHYINNNKFKYKLKIPIINYNIDDNNLIKKIYSISLIYENDVTEFSNKIILIINYMNSLFSQNLIQELIIFFDILLDGISKNILQISNNLIIDDENINKLNNLLMEISMFKNDNLKRNICELIFYLLKFEFNYNKKYMIYNLDKISSINKNKLIIDNNIIYMIIKNFLMIENQFYKQIELLNFILIYCLDYNEQMDLQFIETSEGEGIKEQNKPFLIKAPNILVKIINILYEIKDYRSLDFVFNKIISLIETSSLNIKIIINNNNLIHIITKLYIELFNNKNEEILFAKINCLLNIFTKYLSEHSLISYLSEVYHLFYNTIISSSNTNESIHKKKIILELYNILKTGIINSKFNNYEYLSISNSCFYNPFIYNSFFIKDLKFQPELNIFICLNINLRISTYKNIGIFYLAEFIDQINNEKLSFYITNEKMLKVESKNKIILEIKNINDILPDDGKFHKVAIIINVRFKIIYFDVDQVKMKLFDINSCKYKSFQFDEFDIFMGYKPDSVKTKLNSSKSLSSIPIIDISNIMLTKFNNFEEYNLINNTKRSMHINDILLENINKDKKYFDNNNNNNKEIQKSIIIDVIFINKNINIIKSNKIKNEIPIMKEYLSNNIFQNKYISYCNIFLPNNTNTIDNCNIHIYLLSLINNVEEYYCLNNPSNIILFNINQKYLQSKMFYNNNTAFSACNYFFIDYLLSFIFDIEKRRNKIMNSREISSENDDDETESENLNQINENKEGKDEKIEIFDQFLTQIILIIFELILNLPNKEIINYFLYENNIFSLKLKIFFSRNIYLFNDSIEFMQKIFDISKSSILEEENKNLEFVLVFISEIFLDLFIFQKLNNKAQNKALTELVQILNCKNLLNKEYLNKNIYKILKQIYKISLFSVLSTNQIDFKLDENSNPTQIDILTKCIKSIFIIFENNKSNEFIDKIIEVNHDIINIHCKFNENFISHNAKSFKEENNDLIESKILDNDSIYKQMEVLTTLYSKSKIKNFETENKEEEENLEISKSIISIISNTSNNSNENKICWFCKYLNIYFKNKLDRIYHQMKFDKIMDKNYINIFLNFSSYRNILGVKNYSWFLSRNEGNHKIQNKFFLKKNDILQKQCSRKKLNGETFTYKYIYDKQKYELSIKSLYKLFLFDNICKDSRLINIISEANNNDNDNVENCLYIKNIHRTLSVIILLKESILILNNICLDNNKKLHVVKNEIDSTIWCVNKESYENELDQFISKNDQDILKDLFKNPKGSNKPIKGFEYNNSYSFSYIKLLFKNIVEMHRTSYLTVPNSIEIFMKDGKSHFICLSLAKREKIFTDIIGKMIEFYRNKEMNENAQDISFKKSNKNVSNTDSFYMKYCPLSYLLNNLKEYNNSISFGYKLNSSARKKANSSTNSSEDIPYDRKGLNINNSKGMITASTFLSEVTELWIKSKVSNFDYIMLLNIISGRSLNNLSQYFIFPRLLNDFNHSILNWMSSSIYRDLSYSIIASDPQNRDDVKKKYETSSGEKYHSGTFYSTYAFVAYFLIRQRPFTEISLEIQGGEFDATDRLFIGAGEICGMKEKYQESIPSLMTLPEIYINNNKYNFGKRQGSSIFVNDFELPNWSKDDPRKFSLVIKRIFENKNISIKLNKWIDIIFGVGQTYPEAIKFMNVYRKACYELPLEEIEELNKKFELLAVLLEKQELGYMAKQIFKKPHKKKENLNEYIENENMFFDTNLKLRKIKFTKINNTEYNKEKDDILFSSINDFLFDIDNNYIKNISINNNSQGGIASLKSIMKAFDDVNNNNLNQKNNNPLKLVSLLEKVNKFVILGNSYYFLGKKFDYILSHNDKYLEIINYKLNIYFCYYLNETNNISTLAVNDKGNKIYVAFNNGNILEYKVIFEDEETVKENKNIKNNNIYPFLKSNTVDKISLKFKDYYYYNLNDENADKSFVSIKRSETKKTRKKSKIKNISPPIISLKKNTENYFTFNNPHIPEKIIKLKLNEENQILIATTVSNIIYLISLNHKFKLMHIINYYSNYKFQYKIKDIITFAYNGDFIIYSSMTVHLFSINGVPLCELNLLDKVHESLSQITCCNAIFVYDVILFTGHEDFSVVIWRVKNKNTQQNFNERVSYVYNNNNSKFFLNEYYYNYDYDIENNNNYNIQECELRRKFEIVSQIKMEEDLSSNNLSISYMKMSQDMSYMIILDNRKDVYILSNFDDYKEDNYNNNSNNNLNKYSNSSSSANIFGHFKDKKLHCISCLKEIEDNYYNASMIKSFKGENDDDDTNAIDSLFSSKVVDENNPYINSIINEKDINKNNIKETNYICEECKLKLFNTENYLYNY